jgi:hypothetical protein
MSAGLNVTAPNAIELPEAADEVYAPGPAIVSHAEPS